ncbi:MAG: polysaccharide biosynthesis tyrosine autokinase [Gemmataceae bacterium]
MLPQESGHPEPTNQLPFPRVHPPSPAPTRPEAGHNAGKPVPASAVPSGLSAAPDFFSLLHALRHRWVSAVFLGSLLAGATAVGVWYLLVPKNAAFAQLQVSYQQDKFFGNDTASANDFKTFLQTTAGQIQSRRVIASALKRDEVRKLGLDVKELDAAQMVADELRVEFKDNSELLTIYFSHKEPQVALALVNGIKEAYLEDIVYAAKNERGQKVTELEKVYNEAVDALKIKKENLKKVAKSLGTTDPTMWREQRLELTQALRDAKQQHVQIGFRLVEARASHETYVAKIKGMQKSASSGSPVMEDPKNPPSSLDEAEVEETLALALNKDLEAKQIRAKLEAYKHEIQDLLSKGYRPDYVSVKIARNRANNLQAQYNRIKADMEKQVRQSLTRLANRPSSNSSPRQIPAANSQPVEDPEHMRAQLHKQVESLSTLEENLRNEIGRLTKETAKTPILAAEYEHIADEIKRDEKILEEIGHRLERERVELRAATRIRSFQDAELMKPEIKKQILAAAFSPLAVFGSVAMGLAYLEFRKRRIRSSLEISRGLGIRVVGAIPSMPHLEKYLVNAAGESDLEGTPVMESIDAIRMRLLHEANTRSTRIVMVTSAGHGEGKTTLATSLATSMARAGRKTLLMDGDLRQPALHQLFESPLQPGFSEVLLGEIEVSEAARETIQENLWILPAGQWDREVLLSLSRDGLEGIFERLTEEYDCIIVDSHPVLHATDSLLIGRRVDAVLLSALREVSQLPRFYAAQQQLQAVGIRVLGAVVNGASPEEAYMNTNHGSPALTS